MGGITIFYNQTKTTSYDVKKELPELLTMIWNLNIHSDKSSLLDCVMYENWCIEFARTKWQPNYINFDFATERIQQNDRTFINFDKIGVHGS